MCRRIYLVHCSFLSSLLLTATGSSITNHCSQLVSTHWTGKSISQIPHYHVICDIISSGSNDIMETNSNIYLEFLLELQYIMVYYYRIWLVSKSKNRNSNHFLFRNYTSQTQMNARSETLKGKEEMSRI